MPNVLSVSRTYSGLARTVSDVCSPPALAIPGLLLCALVCDVAGVYRFALVYLIVAVLPPMFYVLWLLRTNQIDDFHLPNRQDRFRPFLATLISAFAALSLLVLLGAPTFFLTCISALILQILVLFLITLFWQVSVHTATAAALVTFAVLAFDERAAALFLFLPFVGWARVYLERHTVTQCIAGVGVGCCCFPLLFAACGHIW